MSIKLCIQFYLHLLFAISRFRHEKIPHFEIKNKIDNSTTREFIREIPECNFVAFDAIVSLNLLKFLILSLLCYHVISDLSSFSSTIAQFVPVLPLST